MARGGRERSGLDRLPPHSIEAEESLIGAMLLSREAISEAIELVTEDDFFKPSLRHVFHSLTALYSGGSPTDVVSVAESLRRDQVLDIVGGTEALLVLEAGTPAVGSAARYAQIVRDYALLRRLISAATEIAEQAYSVPKDVGEVVDYAEARILEVAKGNNREAASHVRDVIYAALEQLEAMLLRGDSLASDLATGFRDLDEKLSGLQRSNLIIVGARPGMGKTSFALSLAANVASTATDPVLIFSLEMSKQEIGQRLLAGESRVDSMKIRSGRLADRDWDRIAHAAGRLSERRIFIDDDPNVTVLDIRARARRLKSVEGLSLVVVDYLQLMSGRRNVESRQVEVSEISRGLKLLARELDVPVIALSQLSRNLENRAEKRPQLADLRESGCLGWESLITLADGSQEPVGLLWAKGASEFGVCSFDELGRPTVATAHRAVATGVKKVVKVYFEDGYSLVATPNHRVFTEKGWSAVGGLGVQDEVLVTPRGSSGDSTTTTLSRTRVKEQIELGQELVFDLEVAETHAFFANGVGVHNSLEQDADVVMFIYRDEAYRPDSADRGIAEVIISKHRNGPIGTVYLAFMENWALFADIATN